MANRKKPRILVIGSANMDLMAKVNTMPSGGETVMGKSYEYLPGGKGANAALSFSRLGAECIFCTRLGNDVHGGRLKEFYSRSDIDTRHVMTDFKSHTGLAIVLVEKSGENRIVVYPGANMTLNAEHAEDAMTTCPDALFMQFEMPTEVVLAATESANRHNIPVFIDAGPAKSDFPLEKLGKLEVFSPNETETYVYTGIEPRGEQSCLKAAMKLSQRVDARYIVLKLGSRGAYVYDNPRCSFKSAIPVNAVDTTAAGDVFTSALTFEMMRSGDILRSVEFGNIAGALSVTRAGASQSIPTMEEIKAFIAENEINFAL